MQYQWDPRPPHAPVVPEGRGGACEERLVLTGRHRDSSLVGKSWAWRKKLSVRKGKEEGGGGGDEGTLGRGREAGWEAESS